MPTDVDVEAVLLRIPGRLLTALACAQWVLATVDESYVMRLVRKSVLVPKVMTKASSADDLTASSALGEVLVVIKPLHSSAAASFAAFRRCQVSFAAAT